MELGLEGRRAVVTGGSKGLGLAIAHELASEGCHVAICARDQNEVDSAASELGSHGTTVYGAVADVTDPDQVDRFIAEAAEALGGIDILVNNAGRATPGDFTSLDDTAWQGDLEVKLFSMIRCSRAALEHLRGSDQARIININAVQGKVPDPKFFATSTNRAATIAFTKTLSLQLASDNILVNGINVGFVVTPQWKNIHQKRAPELAEDEFFTQMASSDVPLGRFGQPEEVAAAVAFLASSRASFITGANIDVAGGMGRYT